MRVYQFENYAKKYTLLTLPGPLASMLLPGESIARELDRIADMSVGDSRVLPAEVLTPAGWCDMITRIE